MNEIAATVIVPTTKDRGPLLQYSVGSILNQTIKNLEVFIIGDGVYDETRQMIFDLQNRDSRIKFFDHPKHERRGEIHRHQALQEAQGRIVCYLCDRDLMLTNHIENLRSRLKKYNFVSVNYISVFQDGSLEYGRGGGRFGERDNLTTDRSKDKENALSSVGHTLDFYKKLPYGWRTTPISEFTDEYMWQQFLDHPECNAFFDHKVSILYFKRDHHPGWPVNKRLPELVHWSNNINGDECIDALEGEAFLSLMKEREELRKKLSKNWLLLKGKVPSELPLAIFRKVARLLKKP